MKYQNQVSNFKKSNWEDLYLLFKLNLICFPGSLKKTLPSHLDLNKIVSPVGQYIRSNPAPPIMRQIRPKTTKHFDDDLAAFERKEELLRTPPESEKKKRLFKPLPMAEYKSSRVALEQRVTSPREPMKALPKFGITPSVEAKV